MIDRSTNQLVVDPLIHEVMSMHSCCWPTQKTFLCVHGTKTSLHWVHLALQTVLSQPQWQNKPSGHKTTNHHPKAFWLTGGIDKALAGTPSSWETRESAGWRYGGRLQRRQRVRVQYCVSQCVTDGCGSACSTGHHRCVTIYRMHSARAEMWPILSICY